MNALKSKRMIKPQLSSNVQAFIDALINIAPQPDSIWLIGSQANGRATENSDTDILVFGTPEFYRKVQEEITAPIQIDCLIVQDGNHYQDPWQEKSGSIERLKWHRVTDVLAEYIGSKWEPDEESSIECNAEMGELKEPRESALRVWPF